MSAALAVQATDEFSVGCPFMDALLASMRGPLFEHHSWKPLSRPSPDPDNFAPLAEMQKFMRGAHDLAAMVCRADPMGTTNRAFRAGDYLMRTVVPMIAREGVGTSITSIPTRMALADQLESLPTLVPDNVLDCIHAARDIYRQHRLVTVRGTGFFYPDCDHLAEGPWWDLNQVFLHLSKGNWDQAGWSVAWLGKSFACGKCQTTWQYAQTTVLRALGVRIRREPCNPVRLP